MSTCSCSTTPVTTCTCQSCGAAQTISWNNVLYKPSYISEDNLPGLATTELTSAEVLDLFTTPIEILAAPGPDIIRYPTQIILKLDYNSAAYVSANPIRVQAQSGANYMFEAAAAFLTSTGNVLVVMERAGTVNDNIAVNTGWEIFVPVANPTTGDSPVTVYVRYETIVL